MSIYRLLIVVSTANKLFATTNNSVSVPETLPYRNVFHLFGRHLKTSLINSLCSLFPPKTVSESQETVNDAAVRKIVTEINAKLAEREIDQRLNFVHYEWDDTNVEFLVFCNTFAPIGYVCFGSLE